MNRFLLLALTAGILSSFNAKAFSKYTSQEQAKSACIKWANAGGVYYSFEKPLSGFGAKDWRSYERRWCFHLEDEKLWYGTEVGVKKNGRTKTDFANPTYTKKRFRY